MGVNQGSKLLFMLIGITFAQLVSLCCKRAEDVGRMGAPAVAGDISWLCYKLRKTSIANTATYVTELILKFVEEGFVFYAAFDPADGRHHTKKASIRREKLPLEKVNAVTIWYLITYLGFYSLFFSPSCPYYSRKIYLMET